MSKSGGLRVALVGLGFGAEFTPIYRHHPGVRSLTICDPDPRVLETVGEKFEIEKRCSDFRAVLDSSEIDAVHLVTPIPLHAEQSLAVLKSGKHCACTVPMALTLDDLRAVTATQRSTGKNYMMMETAAYTREFLFVKGLLGAGELGRIQFLRGAHYQDMENWPSYWDGLPPMHYATHAVAPLFLLSGRRAAKVHCFGSGWMREELRTPYANPFPIESAIFLLAGGGTRPDSIGTSGSTDGSGEDDCELVCEVTRSLFHTAKAYTESFHVYGEKASFEWQQIEKENPVLFRIEPLSGISSTRKGRGRSVSPARVDVPDRQDLLPEPIRRFTQRGVYDEKNPHRSFLQGGGHGGSHPHLVHEFVSSILEDRPPVLDAAASAHITAAGICAHQSAMKSGEGVEIPRFDIPEADRPETGGRIDRRG